MVVPKSFKKRRKKSKNHSHLVIFSIFLSVCAIPFTFSQENANMNAMFLKDLEAYEKSEKSVATAMVDVIREFYIAKDIKFDFFIYGERTNHIDDVIGEVTMKLSEDNVTVTLRQILNFRKWNHKMKQSTIIFTKSYFNLAILNYYSMHLHMNYPKYQLTNTAPKQFKFLIYCEEIKNIKGHQKLVKDFKLFDLSRPTDFRFYEFLITNERDFVTLSANKLYSKNHCENFKLVTLNSYDKMSQRWIKKLENHNLYDDFYGCLLKFSSMHFGIVRLRNYIHKSEKKLQRSLRNNNVEFEGLLHDILKELVKKINFCFHYTIVRMTKKNNFYAFGSRKLEARTNRTIFFMWGSFAVSSPENYYSLPTSGIEMYYLVSWNDLYTNYEKMVLPFDFVTWVFLSFTFGLTFGVIFGLHQCPQWIRQVVFGRSKHRPLFDLK
jgi:hypothetical protein